MRGLMACRLSSSREKNASWLGRNDIEPWYGVQSSMVARERCIAVNHL